MKIIGLDLSLSATGLCMLNDELIIVDTIVTDKKKEQIERIDSILNEVTEYLNKGEVRLAVIEKPFSIMGHGKILLELNGVIKHRLFKRGIEVVEINQTVLKKYATGNGRAEKDQMKDAALKEFGVKTENDNEADAFFLALIGKELLAGKCGSNRYRDEVLKKIEFPSAYFS